MINDLPFYDICKRSARFIASCLQSESALVGFVARSSGYVFFG